MQIQSAGSPQTLHLNFASESQRRSLAGRLVQGQALEARVVDRLSDGRWAVRFMGHTLIAESRLSLVPGQIVEARVEALGPPLVLSLSGKARSEDAALGQALRELALVDDTLNRAAVKGLIARGLPVDRNAVKALRDLLLGLGGAVDLEDAEALESAISRALFLRGQGLPVTPDTLGAYLSHLPPAALGGLLEGLADLLRSLRLPGLPRSDLSALTDRIQTLLTRPDALNGGALKQLLKDLGIDLEGRLAAWIASGGEGLPEGIDASLKPLLLRLQALLGEFSPDALDGAGRNALEALQGRARDMVQFLDTLQAADLPSDIREVLHLQVPLLFDGQLTTADLRISCGEGGGRRIDPDNLRLSLSLDLTGLGPVRIDLSVVHKQASCRIHTADEQKADFFRAATGELEEALLQRCGYAADITCHVARRAEEEASPEGPPAVGVDFRV